ncbi:glycoside hydrolase family 2 TIM barrel-domain containing protein [Echinicola jeungdonensis]|uniref:Glycoside hydrolase family 2 TIM barrel-domain containing protein n=1 Tax=Echinicola jeungdonensis TaxID=709343 RepID=A0ABV5J0C8_9BACT|nr:glycoside hydrolase family 2 TIM barrel-domain containing protein [Echinicola jeungdonensis]MDN3671106.1 glycoside hydrolase family 2 TIM barrel-domain containing protein [Echinicola jeungdonensis]
MYTAPTDEALRYDLEMTKKLDFNMTRKYIKVETYRWYYWCDKLGLMVWLDMPSPNSYTANNPEPNKEAFTNEMMRMVETNWNSPGIVMWVIFNEGQAQHDT